MHSFELPKNQGDVLLPGQSDNLAKLVSKATSHANSQKKVSCVAQNIPLAPLVSKNINLIGPKEEWRAKLQSYLQLEAKRDIVHEKAKILAQDILSKQDLYNTLMSEIYEQLFQGNSQERARLEILWHEVASVCCVNKLPLRGEIAFAVDQSHANARLIEIEKALEKIENLEEKSKLLKEKDRLFSLYPDLKKQVSLPVMRLVAPRQIASSTTSVDLQAKESSELFLKKVDEFLKNPITAEQIVKQAQELSQKLFRERDIDPLLETITSKFKNIDQGEYQRLLALWQAIGHEWKTSRRGPPFSGTVVYTFSQNDAQKRLQEIVVILKTTRDVNEKSALLQEQTELLSFYPQLRESGKLDAQKIASQANQQASPSPAPQSSFLQHQALQPQAKKLNIPKKIVKKDLDEALDVRRLKKTAQAIQSAWKNRAHRENVIEPFRLKKVSETLNPVAKLETQFYVAAVQMKDETSFTPILSKDLRGACQNVLKKGRREILENNKLSDSEKEIKKAELLKLFSQTIWNKIETHLALEGIDDIGSLEELNALVKSLKELGKNQQFNEDQKKAILEVVDQIEHLDKSLKLEGIPKLCEKDAVISYLRTLFENKEAGPGTLHLMQAIQTIPGSYVSKKTVAILLKKAVIGDQLKIAIHKTVDKMPAYFSAYDIQAHNQEKEWVLEHLQEIAKIDRKATPSFAYKRGEENVREELGAKVASTLGLDSFLLKKTSVDIRGLSIAGDQASLKGLASRWIEGENMPGQLWVGWLEARFAYNIAKEKNELTPEIVAVYQAKRDEVLKFASAQSVGELFLIDLVLGSGDSHMNQFKRTEDASLHNYDFSRFLAPHPLYTKDGETFTCLRSVFLDHPLADEPLTQDSQYAKELLALKEKILSWDVKKIRQELVAKQVIGDKQFFTAAIKQREEIEKEYKDLVSADKNSVLALFTKYNVRVTENEDISVLKKKLGQILEKKYQGIRNECWKKVDPLAIEEMEKRVESIQNYLKTESKPTLKGVWSNFYPELAPFLRLAERLEKDQATALRFIRDKNQAIRLRSLESLIENAKEKNLINENEAVIMKNKLKDIQAQCVTSARALLSMGGI